MTPQQVQAGCAVVSALAAVASFGIAAAAISFAKKSGQKIREQEERFADCLQALVIAQLVSNKSFNPNAMVMFKELYKGKTEIFKK